MTTMKKMISKRKKSMMRMSRKIDVMEQIKSVFKLLKVVCQAYE
jgi:hypothetical protein